MRYIAYLKDIVMNYLAVGARHPTILGVGPELRAGGAVFDAIAAGEGVGRFQHAIVYEKSFW